MSGRVLMSDREQFEAARAAGLKARHETRVERATTVVGEHDARATVQAYRGCVRLWVSDEAGTSGASVLLPPEAAERLARILTQTKTQVETS